MNDRKSKSWNEFYGEAAGDDPVFWYTVLPSEPRPPMSLSQAFDYLVASMAEGPVDRLSDAFEVVDGDDGQAYRRVLEAVLDGPRPSGGFRAALHMNWTVRGFRHRAQLDDDTLLVRAFRHVFPAYVGEAMTVYRGERSSELGAGRLGLNWTPDRSVAERFARGLCATYGGEGVLLQATAAPPAIISGPNDHSANWICEHEHIVDPSMLSNIIELARFPPISVG